MIYLELLWSFIQIGLFSIGGGYAAMPLIQHQVIDIHGWLTLGEFADIMTISQMTPGPIAINSATFVGIRIAGIPGALVATIGCVLPSSIIVSTLAFIYYKFKGLDAVQSVLKGLRPAVVAMIATAALSLTAMALCNSDTFTADINILNAVILVVALLILRIFKINPIIVMAGAGVIGLVAGLF
ncbi:MAG: chromate transporter [Spirochaetes bacterium]|uniref:Chromate transporter n=1 Tax=Candidatus Ornithospirochaeta stercoripullorum TaxID=2840899 RepID=A0A9D9H5Z0_9SPIO|nr:chromate transporter [Candidatus Ornithospirochaeta stercoripullorum]